MCRKFVFLLFGFVILALAGCAFDDHGRGHFSGRGGSLKDTHLDKRAAYKGNSYKGKSRSVARKYPAAKKRKMRVARLQKKVVVNQVPHTKKMDTPKQLSEASNGEKEDEAVNNNAAPKARVTQKTEKVVEEETGKKNAQVTRKFLENDAPITHDNNKNIIVKTDQAEREPKTQSKPAESKKTSTKIALNKERKPLLDSEKEEEKQSVTMHVETQGKRIEKKKKTAALNANIMGEGASAFAVVKVHYATDRNLSGQSAPKKVYGIKRSSISYGTCEVSIPRNHKMGEIEAPSMWRLEFGQNDKKHVVLKSVKRRSKTRFFQDVRSNVKLSLGKNAFIFIHGYNIEFHEAALRTAQIAYDLRFDGAPIFYSWPSRGGYKDYTRDEANVRWTQTNLKRFLKDFISRSDAKNIYLIAHSMGARALTAAVAELVTEMPSARKRIKEVLLAAPDIDAEVFKRDIAPKLVKASRNVTLYASADDKALQLSRTIHGEPRAGDAGENLVVVKGVDTIDATGIDTSLFGHAYFAEVPTIITDMHALIMFGRRPKDRPGLQSVLASEGQYWAFRRNKTIIINGTTVPDDIIREIEH